MDVDYPRALLWSFAVVVVVALAVAASTSAAAFGAFNPAWDGASELRSQATAAGADATVAESVAAYETVEANGTVAVVLSPGSAYTDDEAASVRAFVRRGGTLVVAEDFGAHGNPLLAAVGADARVDGRLLRDERNNYRSPAMPVAGNVSDHELTDGADQLTLNYGTVVRPNGATVLARSSGFGYLDGNRNGQLDDAERLDSYPVATVESVGEGRVVVVSDPSLAINAMLDREGNRAFVRGLFDGADRVLLDYSHAESLPPLTAAVYAVRGSGPLQLLVGLFGVGAIAVWAGRPRVVAGVRAALGRRLRGSRPASETGPARASESALVAHLADARPDWDRERVEQVVEAARRREED